MTVQRPNFAESARQTLLTRSKIRLRNADTGELLHLSGTGTTSNAKYSWLGTKQQAETLRLRAIERGHSWPFTAVPRNLLEQPMADEQ